MLSIRPHPNFGLHARGSEGGSSVGRALATQAQHVSVTPRGAGQEKSRRDGLLGIHSLQGHGLLEEVFRLRADWLLACDFGEGFVNQFF